MGPAMTPIGARGCLVILCLILACQIVPCATSVVVPCCLVSDVIAATRNFTNDGWIIMGNGTWDVGEVDLGVGRSLTISGSTGTFINAIKGFVLYGAFYVSSPPNNVTITLMGLNITQGNADFAVQASSANFVILGGIMQGFANRPPVQVLGQRGNLTVVGTLFVNNPSKQLSGAIAASEISSITLVNATFIKCSALVGSTSAGAIYIINSMLGRLDVIGCVFRQCSTDSRGGVITASGIATTITSSEFTSVAAPQGGAADITGGSLTVSNSIFQNCSTSMTGGAIHIVNSNFMTVTNSSFVGTTARSDGGGAIWANNLVSGLSVQNSTFRGTTCVRGTANLCNGGGIPSSANIKVWRDYFGSHQF